jgi:hypothetical protein
MDDASLHARVLEYARRLDLPRACLRELERCTPVGSDAEYFRVETLVWWERRYFVLPSGEREEDPWEGSEVLIGPQPPTADPHPTRWAPQINRPAPFTSVEWQFDPNAGHGNPLVVRFGTSLAAETIGDQGFPVSLVNTLPVRARFEGLDTEPVMTQRGGSPYRETARLPDRTDIPETVMTRVRAFVRELDLPGYTDRIHGWRTSVRGGSLRKLEYQLVVGDRALSATVRAALPSGFLYAPELSDWCDAR